VKLEVVRGNGEAGEGIGGRERAMRFYRPEDPGIGVDVHRSLGGYYISGPEVWGDAEPVVQDGEEGVRYGGLGLIRSESRPLSFDALL
jgi:hypothetical protein